MCGSASLASGLWLQSIVWEEHGAGKQGKGRSKRGSLLPAAPCPLMSHLLVMCHSFLDGSPGWESWAEWQSRSSVLAVPSPCTRQGLAELLGGTGSTELGRGSGTSLAAPSSLHDPKVEGST